MNLAGDITSTSKGGPDKSFRRLGVVGRHPGGGLSGGASFSWTMMRGESA